MSVSKGGSRQTQAGTSSVDGTTMQYLQQMMAAAKGAGGAGPSPLVGGATDFNNTAMGAGATGLKALGGDAGAIGSLMNLYQQQVIDAMRQQGAVTDQNTTNMLGDAATKAGAFGGTRQGVATGVALGENARNLNSGIAGLLSSGYDNAMNRAGMAAGYGFQGAGANANLGMAGVGSPRQWMLNMLRQGFVMPTGQQSNNSTANVSGSASFNPLMMFGGS